MKKLLISLMVAFCALTSVNFNINAQDFKSSNLIYDDVNSSQWFYKVVYEASEKGFMGKTAKANGVYFEPNLPMSRSMVATVLYRMAGTPTYQNNKTYSDVKDGMWYAKAIGWASANGVLSGYKDGRFGVDDNITRQDLAIMLRNYASKNGIDTSIVSWLGNFQDASKVSSYATSAMKWAIKANIISGSKTSKGLFLNPNKNATRAECAKIKKHLIS